MAQNGTRLARWHGSCSERSEPTLSYTNAPVAIASADEGVRLVVYSAIHARERLEALDETGDPRLVMRHHDLARVPPRHRLRSAHRLIVSREHSDDVESLLVQISQQTNLGT